MFMLEFPVTDGVTSLPLSIW